jgi:Protein of unknown function (DUF3304)
MSFKPKVFSGTAVLGIHPQLLRKIGLSSVLLASLVGCFEEEKVAVSYVALNHTDHWIGGIGINGEGGILNSSPFGGGGKEVCCVLLPRKWHPGLQATIKWQDDGEWLKDASGNEVIRNGKRVLVEGPWHTQTVEVPEYDKTMGQFHIHIFAPDQVKVVVSLYGAGHPKHPYPYPTKQSEK